MRHAGSIVALLLVSSAPLAFVACDLNKKKDEPEGGAASATALATTAATPDTTPTATPSVVATVTAIGTVTAPPGTRIVKLADGGAALINDAGQIITDAGKFAGFTLPSAMPSGMPSGLAIPSTMPSQLVIPSVIPIPSGLTLPPFPGAPDAGKK